MVRAFVVVLIPYPQSPFHCHCSCSFQPSRGHLERQGRGLWCVCLPACLPAYCAALVLVSLAVVESCADENRFGGWAVDPKWLPASEPQASLFDIFWGFAVKSEHSHLKTPGFASEDVHPSFGVTGSHVGWLSFQTLSCGRPRLCPLQQTAELRLDEGGPNQTELGWNCRGCRRGELQDVWVHSLVSEFSASGDCRLGFLSFSSFLSFIFCVLLIERDSSTVLF